MSGHGGRYLLRRIILAFLSIVWLMAFIRLAVPDACVHPLAHVLALPVVVLLPLAVVSRIGEGS